VFDGTLVENLLHTLNCLALVVSVTAGLALVATWAGWLPPLERRDDQARGRPKSPETETQPSPAGSIVVPAPVTTPSLTATSNGKSLGQTGAGQPRRQAARGPMRERAASRKERREWLRRVGELIQVDVADADGLAKPYAGKVVDRSRGGLCLAVGAPVEVGTRLRIRSSFYDETAPWVQVEVKRCWNAQGQWLLGCKFLQELPWSVLLLFG
jgi:hypothetical protein